MLLAERKWHARWLTWSGVLLTGLLLLAGTSRAQDTSTPSATSTAEFARAKHRWQAAGVHDYQFKLTRSCECLPEEPIRIVVHHDKVVSAHYSRSGNAVSAERQRRLPTLDGIFGTIDAAYKRPAASIQLRLHPTLGYPERVFIDYDARIADEELIYEITDFSH